MEGRQGREELGLSSQDLTLDVSWIQLPCEAAWFPEPGSGTPTLVPQALAAPTSHITSSTEAASWALVMLEGPIKSLSAHGMAPQLCFDMPTPRISSNQAEGTSYHMGIKHSEQELSSLFLTGSYKTHFKEYLCIS